MEHDRSHRLHSLCSGRPQPSCCDLHELPGADGLLGGNLGCHHPGRVSDLPQECEGVQLGCLGRAGEAALGYRGSRRILGWIQWFNHIHGAGLVHRANRSPYWGVWRGRWQLRGILLGCASVSTTTVAGVEEVWKIVRARNRRPDSPDVRCMSEV